MKIGTDAVLLGAWAPIRDAKRILDVGTGSGIIALMLAQRTARIGSQIHAIDIDEPAAGQAIENFAASRWSDRLPEHVNQVHQSLEKFSQACDVRFDLVVSNPPFFASPGCMTDSSRKVARQTSEDDRQRMLLSLIRVLDEAATLCLVLPFEQADATIQITESEGMHLWSRTDVRPTPDSKPKRTLLELGTRAADQNHNELIVEIARHQFSDQYAELTRDFHLRYADQ